MSDDLQLTNLRNLAWTSVELLTTVSELSSSSEASGVPLVTLKIVQDCNDIEIVFASL